MAKLGAYYGLCPLIDHRSLLGISQDEENGIVIVTLGKNIAIKFKLSDQKQLYSWRTREKFSSPIIYDNKESQYFAVFNESFVRSWSGNEEFLDKLKKLKFSQQIYTIFLYNEKSFIVFKNGAVYLLHEAIENRKDLVIVDVIDPSSEYITDILQCNLHDQIYIGLLVTNTNKQTNYLCWTKFTDVNKQDKYYKVCLQRKDCDLQGYVFYSDRTSVRFLSLWSDARLYSLDLKESDVDSSHIGELFTVVESLSCKKYVSMISLDQNYIALYGCNSNEEGALLVVYNVQFKVVQSKQSFKLFTNGAKLWCINENLFFPVGQNLAVVPFYLDTEQLAALVGSHNIIETDPDPDISIIQKVQFVNWGQNPKSTQEKVPAKIKTKVEDFMSQGHCENTSFDTLLSDVLEHKDLEAIEQAMKYFSDISENSLVKVLKLLLGIDSKCFKDKTLSQIKNFPQCVQPLARANLLNLALAKSFNETLILPQLRSVLTLDEILCLLQYINFLLSEDGYALTSLNSSESEAKLIEWSCVLLDSNYQKILLSKDDKIYGILTAMRDLIKDELSYSEEMRQVASLLYEIKCGRTIHKSVYGRGLEHSVEEFPLY